ncbi:hypothetical protein PAXRUDRAFT_21549 [Paxillus rubicundulus Ve08.2h10]|uniref:Uncharacterized protein n=1 Tax=Paxillus rubicundulus Ve08.2h10 TaxID=930991 RepID=A0A0D0CBD5_9AGAM|nr:hypothetical protein PAXRUDRAFT_21549 [Paxillus rubicundulus Ve08.2h10]
MSDSTIESASEDESLAIKWAPMSKEVEEEEGEEHEGEDEKGEADLDVIAESHQTAMDELQRGCKKESSGDHA